MSFTQPFGFEDPFGKLIADNTENEIDIPSHFNFSSERLMLDVNGSRAFVQYGSVSQFTDSSDTFDLQPGADDTVGIESSESISYTVGFAASTNFAFGINQSLQSGDSIRFGPHISGTDGWVMEQRGADHTDTQVDVIEIRSGTETTLASDVELDQPITDFLRYEVIWNWYNVGNQIWTQTFTNNGDQNNNEIVKTSNDTGRGPARANLPTRIQVTASGSTTGLEVNMGSMAAVTLGDVVELDRRKNQEELVSLPNEHNTWHPVYAIRTDPNDSVVNMQLTNLQVFTYGNDAKLQLMAISVDPSKTDASGFGTPSFQTDANTAIQSTTSVSQIPNASGTQVTPDSNTDPGGFQVTQTSLYPVGGQFQKGAASSTTEVKSPIYASDIVVILAKSPNSGANLEFGYSVTQTW